MQLHRRACVQRVQLQLSVEADKLKHKFFGLPLYSWPSRDLARIHRIPGCEIFVHFFEPLRIGVRPRTCALGGTCGGSGDVGAARWAVVIVVILQGLQKHEEYATPGSASIPSAVLACDAPPLPSTSAPCRAALS